MTEPRFTTVIRAHGPDANIYAVLGTARNYLRQLGISQEERDALYTEVTNAGSYAEAFAAVRKWFPVDVD